MKKLNKVAVLFASAALVAPIAAFAQSQTNDNWQNPNGLQWKNGSNELCWRDANWTADTAAEDCDGAKPKAPAASDVKPAQAPAPAAAAAAAAPAAAAKPAAPAAPVAPAPAEAAAPRVAPVPVPAPAPAPAPAAPAAPAAPTSEKVSFAADAFFDFDKSNLKPDGKAKLDDLVDKTKSVNLEVIIAVGHTDAKGTPAYNQKLSVRRADAVKAYLVGKGVEKNRVYTEGKGQAQPVADNKTAEGRAKNRRVEIEVVGTRTVNK